MRRRGGGGGGGRRHHRTRNAGSRPGEDEDRGEMRRKIQGQYLFELVAEITTELKLALKDFCGLDRVVEESRDNRFHHNYFKIRQRRG